MEAVKLVAFISSPLQALNFVEYSERVSRQVELVVVGGGSVLEPDIRTQIEAVLAPASPRKIVYSRWLLSLWSPIGARRAVSSAVTALRQYLCAGPYEFVIGEYRSDFSWAVLHRLETNVRSVVVVDDGTATLRINRCQPLMRSRGQWRQKIKSLLFPILGIRGVVPPTGLTFFTMFSLEGRIATDDSIMRNDFRTLSAELRDLAPDDEVVYVIGGPHGEAMSGLFDAGEVFNADVELALELTRFAADYTGKEVVYVAHRREQSEKLEILGHEVTVITPNVPFEIYPRAIGKRPRTIVSYYSSVLVTAAELLGDSVEIIALRIPRDRVNDSWTAFVDSVYLYYEAELDSQIRVVEWPGSSPHREIR